MDSVVSPSLIALGNAALLLLFYYYYYFPHLGGLQVTQLTN